MMNEHCYSELPLKAQGKTLAIPAALIAITLIGASMQVEPFGRYLPWTLGLVGIILVGFFALHLMQGEQQGATLRINEKTVTFHSGGVPVTLFWREIFGVEAGQAPMPGTGLLHERVLIIARRAGTNQQDLETLAFDHLYGQTPAALSAVIRQHWNDATGGPSPARQAVHRHAAGSAARAFGRRATDRA